MSGDELIAWAVRKCAAEKLPPYDVHILNFIREIWDLNTLVPIGPAKGKL